MRHYINHIINFVEALIWDLMAPRGVTTAIELTFYDKGVSMRCDRPNTHFATVVFRKAGKKDIRFHVWDGDTSLMILAMTNTEIVFLETATGFTHSTTWKKFAEGLHFCAA